MKTAGPRCNVRQSHAERHDRFKVLFAQTGLGVDGLGKLLHVTPRTVRNWLSGSTAVPYAAFKLLRVLRGFELPMAGFEGWCMHSGKLWTPEGRPIEPSDGGWWSLLVRLAHSFRVLYQKQTAQRLVELGTAGARGPACGDESPGVALASVPLASVQESLVGLQHELHAQGPGSEVARPSALPDGNHGEHKGIMGPIWGHVDVIMASWPLTSDSLKPSKPMPAPVVSASESASTPLSASPLTPICEGLNRPRGRPLPPKLSQLHHIRQRQGQRQHASLNSLQDSPSCANVRPSPSSLQSPFHRSSRYWDPSRPRRIANAWPSGTGTTRKPDDNGGKS